MTPNERVAHLVRMCAAAFPEQTGRLHRVARVRRMRNHACDLT